MQIAIKFLVFPLLFLGVNFLSNAQSIPNLKITEKEYVGNFRINPKSDGVKGTPFLFEIPPKGKISLEGGKEFDGIIFNILLDKNAVYIQSDGEESTPLLLRNWELIEIIGENGKARIFRMEYLLGKPQVVEILYEKNGEKYIVQHSKRLIIPSGQRDGYSGPQYDTFRHDIDYFKLKGMQCVEIKTNKEGLNELAGDKRAVLKDFLKENKLDPNDPENMKQILTFLLD